jgi:hypothetical protein
MLKNIAKLYLVYCRDYTMTKAIFDKFIKQEVSFKLTILVNKIIIMTLLTLISFHSFLIKFLVLSKFVPHKPLYTNLSVCISLSKLVLHSVGHPFILFPIIIELVLAIYTNLFSQLNLTETQHCLSIIAFPII